VVDHTSDDEVDGSDERLASNDTLGII
jgi:hypothetical protein